MRRHMKKAETSKSHPLTEEIIITVPLELSPALASRGKLIKIKRYCIWFILNY